MTDENDSDFGEAELSEDLLSIMREQEAKTPRLAYLHDHLSGAYREIETLLQALMQTSDDEVEGEILRAIEAEGVKALRPLLHFFLSIKSARKPS